MLVIQQHALLEEVQVGLVGGGVGVVGLGAHLMTLLWLLKLKLKRHKGTVLVCEIYLAINRL